jgi:hypothetical protein
MLALWATVAVAIAAETKSTNQASAFVRVSPRDPRYLELSDGRPYIPIGLNLIAPDGGNGPGETNGLRRMEQWMEKLSANGGNYIRVWASSPFWDVESERSGVYEEAKARRLEALLAAARRHDIRVKLTLEHFREMSDQPRQRWANKPLHLVANGGPATNLADFFLGARSRDQFKAKLDWYARRLGENPTVYGWELWNEVNAVAAREEAYMPWTAEMLGELHRRFPHQLALQSLGSFDTDRARDLYRRQSLLAGNDVAQVHRYLDLGASLEVCHGSMEGIAVEAVRELLRFNPGRPVILAESGAVEPRHSGPFKLYAKDKAGILLHDILFAPFFAGAAGAGQIWHWDVYVDRQNLWHHFGRFAKAVQDLDPPAEDFRPMELEHARLRVLALRGRHTVLIWCRDKQNTWQTELEQERAPESLVGTRVDLGALGTDVGFAGGQCYNPWQDRTLPVQFDGRTLVLPEFARSLVVRFRR